VKGKRHQHLGNLQDRSHSRPKGKKPNRRNKKQLGGGLRAVGLPSDGKKPRVDNHLITKEKKLRGETPPHQKGGPLPVRQGVDEWGNQWGGGTCRQEKPAFETPTHHNKDRWGSNEERCQRCYLYLSQKKKQFTISDCTREANLEKTTLKEEEKVLRPCTKGKEVISEEHL